MWRFNTLTALFIYAVKFSREMVWLCIKSYSRWINMSTCSDLVTGVSFQLNTNRYQYVRRGSGLSKYRSNEASWLRMCLNLVLRHKLTNHAVFCAIPYRVLHNSPGEWRVHYTLTSNNTRQFGSTYVHCSNVTTIYEQMIAMRVKFEKARM